MYYIYEYILYVSAYMNLVLNSEYFLFASSSLAIKNAEDNAPTRRDPASVDLLLDGEQ